MAPVLNLNNEVVKMRKDVKKVKVLTIRRLTRQMSKLKSKKGTDELIQKNQRRAQRLLEEIYTIKKLKPDDVTKTALRKEINFEKVCKKPNGDIETRAIARLASHPLLKQKISTIKDAVKDFKEARKSTAKLQTEGEETCEQPKTERTCTETKNPCKQGEPKQKKKDSKPKNKSVAKTACKTVRRDADFITGSQEHEDETLGFQKNDRAPALLEIPKVLDERTPDDCLNEKEAVEDRLEDKGSKPEENILSIHQSGTDIEDSDKEEKEYFDDSTEERFYNQGSDFNESDSDSDGDFFIGKVRRTKKKKSSKNCSEDKVEKESAPKEWTKSSDGPSETPKAITSFKTIKLQSVFCSSLSDTKQKSSLVKRENKPLPVRNKKAAPQVNKLAKKHQPARSIAVKSQQKPETALHPSWQASKKRKEQSQIAVFQGKKIVFDD